MVLRSCWRCFRVYPQSLLQHPSHFQRTNTAVLRVSIIPQPQQRSSPFSASASLQKSPLVKKSTAGPQQTQKGVTTLKIKKKSRPVKTGKSMQEGDRKAKRKALVLSNTLANNVPLVAFAADDATSPEANGSMRVFGGEMVSTLRNLEGFRLKQGWNLFLTPASLIRQESLELGRHIAWVNGEKGVDAGIGAYDLDKGEVVLDAWAKGKHPWAGLAAQSKSVTRVIHGARGSGKSVLLLQAMAWAAERQWVVITIPDTQDLVICHTEYEHDLTSGLWVQREYTVALLKRIHLANRNILRQVSLSRAYTFGKHDIQQGSTLAALVDLGTNDSTISWEVFLALLDELALPGRPPVLFTLDNLNLISIPTAYRDPNFKFIHAHDFALPATFLDYLTGKKSFWRGVILAATSSKSPRTEALDYALRGETPPAYEKIDPRIAPSINGAPVLYISRLTREQTKALMQYYKDSGLYTQDIDATLPEKYAVSSGNPKELLASCMRLRC